MTTRPVELGDMMGVAGKIEHPVVASLLGSAHHKLFPEYHTLVAESGDGRQQDRLEDSKNRLRHLQETRNKEARTAVEKWIKALYSFFKKHEITLRERMRGFNSATDSVKRFFAALLSYGDTYNHRLDGTECSDDDVLFYLKDGLWKVVESMDQMINFDGDSGGLRVDFRKLKEDLSAIVEAVPYTPHKRKAS